MGLAYFFLVHYDTGGSRSSGCFIGVGVDNLEKISFKIFSVIPVLLAVPCAAAAFYLLAIVWREPPWGFHF